MMIAKGQKTVQKMKGFLEFLFKSLWDVKVIGELFWLDALCVVHNKENVDALPQRQASASILEPLTAKKEEKKRKRDANSVPENPLEMGTNEEKTIVGKLEESLDAVSEPSGKKKKTKKENADKMLANGPITNQEKDKIEEMPDEESLRRKEINSIQNGFTFTPDRKATKEPSTDLVPDSGKMDSLVPGEMGEIAGTQSNLSEGEQEKKVKKKKKVKQKENTPLQTEKEEGSPINGTPDVSIGDEIDTKSKTPNLKKIGEENSISKKDKKKKKKKKKSKDKANLQTWEPVCWSVCG